MAAQLPDDHDATAAVVSTALPIGEETLIGYAEENVKEEEEQEEQVEEEDDDDDDGEIDPALAAAMGFSSFGSKPRPKKRKATSSTAASPSSGNANHKQKQKHSHATGANAVMALTSGASRRQAAASASSYGHNSSNPSILQAFNSPAHGLPPKPPPSAVETGEMMGGGGGGGFGGYRGGSEFGAGAAARSVGRGGGSGGLGGFREGGDQARLDDNESVEVGMDPDDPHYDEDDSDEDRKEMGIKDGKEKTTTADRMLIDEKSGGGGGSSGSGEGSQHHRGDGAKKYDWNALRRGVRNQHGDMAYYDHSFVEDPWRDLEAAAVTAAGLSKG